MDRNEQDMLIERLKRPGYYNTDLTLYEASRLLATGSNFIRVEQHNTILLALIAKIEELENKLTALENKTP